MASQSNNRPLAIVFVALAVTAAGVFWIKHHDSKDIETALKAERAAATPQVDSGICTVDHACDSPTPALSNLSTTTATPALPSALADTNQSASPGMVSPGQETTQAPSARQQQDRFRDLAEQTQKALPTFASFKNLTTEDVHSMPQVLRDAGAKLGDIAQTLADHPELAKDGMEFYRTCYLRSDLVQQIRALCLADHRHWRKELKQDGTAEDLTGVPAQVLDLASKIPN